MGVQISGAVELADSLAGLSYAVDNPAELLSDAARMVRSAAVDAAPKRTGRLAASITISRARRGYAVTARAPYAQFVHYGSVHNPRPVPFMDIASRRSEAAVNAAVDAAVTAAVVKEGL